MAGAIWLPIRYIRKAAFPGYFISLFLLLLVFFPGIGKTVNGSTSWIQTGLFSFQPSEIVKIFLIFVLAKYLSRKLEKPEKDLSHYLKPAIFTAIPLGLILLQTDLGTAFHIILFSSLLFLVSGIPWMTFVLTFVVSLPFIYLFVFKMEKNWRRITGFLEPFSDPTSKGYQLIQSLTSFYNGGFWGKGIGQGVQKNYRLPEPHTDFIFAAMAEEMGLLWSLGIIAIFIILFWRGYRIVFKLNSIYFKFVAAGILMMVLSQALVNIGVVTGSLPITGIPLPFISYGGTHIIITLASMGILLNLSRYQHEETL